MRKRILSIILTLVIVAGLLPSFSLPAKAADIEITSGSINITSGNTYTIADATQLGYFRDIVNAGNNCAGATIKLTNGFISPGAWTPIESFAGTFDGGGCNINNMTINYTATKDNETKDLGLFGEIQSGGTVKNLTVTLSSITYNGPSAYSNNSFIVGGIAGSNYGRIENCKNSATISAAEGTKLVFLMVGGIAGANYGTITGCSSDGIISATNVSVSSGLGLAGICGGYYPGGTPGSVLNCYNAGMIMSNAVNSNSGGIVGFANKSKIENCYNSGMIMSTAGNKAGIAVYLPEYYYGATVSNCHNARSGYPIVKDTNSRVTVTNSYQYNDTNFVSYTNGSDIQTAATLLTTLNAWVNTKASTNYYTWIDGGSYPVLDVPYVPPTYTATVTVNKDGGAFGAGAPTITFGTTVGNAVANGTSVANGTYNIYANGTDTGVDVTVSGSAASVDLNYYTVTFKSQDGNTTLNTQTVLSGQTAVYEGLTPTKTATTQYTYVFSNWVTAANGSSPATLANITAKKDVYANFTSTLLSYTITWKKNASNTIDTTTVAYGVTPTHAVPTIPGYTFAAWTPAIVSVIGAATYTATWTLDTYNISYTLNGGTVASANPVNYTIESTAITLNNPTRTGFAFLGWTGSNGVTAQTSVTIPTGTTGNRSYTADWKSDAPSAPLASIVTAKTNTSISITTESGYEYSVNGTDWYSGTGSYTFTGLSPNTQYNLVCRVAAVATGNTSAASDASLALSVTTKKAAPAAPTLAFDSITASSVTITAVTDAEYSKDNGANWQDSNVFGGLSAATQYTFAIRKKETADTVAGIKASVAQYTSAATPAAGAGYSIDYATEKITVNSGYEVNTDAGFGAGTAIANNVNPNTTYYIRVVASGGVPASAHVSFTLPARPAAPTGITADKTKNSITVTEVSVQEYKIASGNWQNSGYFTGLASNTVYPVYTRVKATGSTFASDAFSIPVTTKSTGVVTTPTLSAVTYDPAKTLADITLPADWAWSAAETIPTVAINSYSAVYTPTDTATVDYSDEAGYANTSGTVTITKTIALTVNRATPTAADFTYAPSASLVYDNTAKSATVTTKGGISGMGTVTVKYYLGGVETSPTNVGTYIVKISLAQGDNYAAATDITDSAWKFDIAKATQASLSITGKPASVTYGNTFNLSTTGGSGTGAVIWAVTSGSSATVNANTGAVIITGVGETTITATKAADGNYTDAVTDTYTFTPAKRLITVDVPTATGGWTKTYDGGVVFDKSIITVGGITNKVGSDAVNVSVQSAVYDTAAIGSGDKTLTIAYAIDGTNSGNYLAPNNTVISTASITAATPTITLKNKVEIYTDKIIEIDAATVKGVTGGTTPDGAITYTYYTKDTCTDGDKTAVDKSGADAIGGAPKNGGTYYVKATIAASGNYTMATSAAVTLTIFYPSSGEDKSSAPVIVDGKTVDMGTSEVKDGTTTVKVDQNKMVEQLKSAKDSVVIPVTSKTDTAAAQLVVQNVEDMAKKGMTLTVQTEGVNYNLPATAVDTAALLKGLEATDSSKVTFTVTMTELSKTAVTIKDGTLMIAPMQFTVTAAYNDKSVDVENFESYVQRDIELPSAVDPKTITTAVVVEANGTQRHVPTEVYSKSGKWYAKINSMTNSTYALIQSSASFTDTAGKWYAAVVTEMASRKVISGIGENMFAGERAITRAEFAAIIVRALGLPTTGTSAFADVASNAWYNGAVGTAFEYGIVSGVGNNKFNPDANITRQDAMVMIERAGKMAGLNSGKTAIQVFSDFNEAASYALSAVNYNTAEGLVKGSDGKLNPKANITRAETATVVLRLLQKAGLVDVRAIA